MLDLSHIPNSQQDIKIFYANSGSFGYQTWQKPRKCNFVYILSIDGGGGGAGGVVAVGPGAQINSTGGGSGAVTRALIDSKFVPDTLYIKVGRGGKGGAAVTVNYTPGNNGEASGVFASSRLSSQALANASFSFLGGYTPAVGGALAASAGALATVAGSSYQSLLTTFTSIAGVSSATIVTTAPVDIQPLASQIVTAGCGGAPVTSGSAFNGGSINSSSFSPRIAGGIGDAALGTDGSNGFTSWKPFFSTGGAGGGNAHTSGGVAGKGGKGGIGSGGGAGGGAALGATSGAGGDGGDGIVIIISF